MSKTASEIVKIIATVIFSALMTMVIMSGTVIKNKADKEYVDKADEKLKIEIDNVKTELKADYLREVKEIKDDQKTMMSDIKELLKRGK